MTDKSKVPNTFAVMAPVDTHTNEVRTLPTEHVLVEIDWEEGVMHPIMQGPTNEVLEEAKGRAHLQSDIHQRDVRTEMAIEFMTRVLGYPSDADHPDADGQPISDHLQWNLVAAMERSPEFQQFIEEAINPILSVKFSQRA